MIPVSPATGVLGIIGHPVAHSLSPALHNAAFAAVGLDLVYAAFDVQDLPAAIAGVRALGIRGLSVTIPHKEAVIPLLDRIDPLAARIGAVNTVVNEQGVLAGYNTDALGAVRALEEAGVDPGTGSEPGDGSVVVLAAGGAARAVAFAVADRFRPARISFADLDQEKAHALAVALQRETGVPATTLSPGSPELAAAVAACSLCINTTPLGMHGKGNPLPAGAFRPGVVYFDIVYTPPRTPFLLAAEAAGARTVTGDRMFLHQAAAQFTLWTGQAAPLDVFSRVLG